jgi:hypothetical protein
MDREREINKETERQMETMKNILRLTFGPITDKISITYPMRGKSFDEILDQIDSLFCKIVHFILGNNFFCIYKMI